MPARCWSGAGTEAVDHVGEPPGAVGQLAERRDACAARRSRAPRPAARRPAPPVARRRPRWPRPGRRGRPRARRACASWPAPAPAPRRVSSTGGIRSPSAKISMASAGIEPGAAPPTSAWWARVAAQPDQPVADEARRHHGDVVEVGAAGEGIVEDDLLARPDRRPSPNRAMASATDAGIDPRCTGMFSAWASSSPSAVNTAAEQSARSLMLGLKAARRSTAPISSATPVSRDSRICSEAGSRLTTSPSRLRSW